jgi:carbon-monoxide dehydrogenase large subunit
MTGNYEKLYEGELEKPDGWVGRAVARMEDDRLLVGKGRYVDDIMLPEQLYAVFIRSPYPSAKIIQISFEQAIQMPGVATCIDASALEGLAPIKPNWIVPGTEARGRPALAKDFVRYVGEPVAVVIADSEAEAIDASEKVEILYEQLPFVLDQDDALQAGAPVVHNDMQTNVSTEFKVGNGGFDEIADAAAFKISCNLKNQRLIPFPIECRAINASYDAASGRMIVYVTQQLPHMFRYMLAQALGFPENKLRVISPDVGGGFGAKMHFYQEDLVTSFASRLLGRPVKWTERRRESVNATTHGRDHNMSVHVAAEEDGKILAIKVDSRANVGAYLSSMGSGIPTVNVGLFIMGVYAIPNAEARIQCVYTNTPPVDAYRGAGRPEAAYVIERTIDRVAHELGIDPAIVRLRNFLSEDALPIRQPTGAMIDSGRYADTLNRAMILSDYDAFRTKQLNLRGDGLLAGIGIGNYTETCGVGPGQVQGLVGFDRGGFESARVRVDSDGRATVFSGSHSHGQGHVTTFAQIAADELKIDIDQIDVIQGDTDSVPQGVGTFNSRSVVVGGSAVKIAAGRVFARIEALAAHLLQIDTADMLLGNGVFRDPASDKSLSYADVSHAAWTGHNVPNNLGIGLDETEFYHPKAMSAPYGSHIAEVEIDAATGELSLTRYTAVDDCGIVINPLLARGQVHGGISQGIGQALFEDGTCGPDGSAPLEPSIPRMDMLPRFQTEHTVTESWTNPLGAKGLGEGGAIGAPPAIVNAAIDALWHLGVRELEMPLTSEKILKAIQAAALENEE